MQFIRLSNGMRMPALGLGTWKAKGDDVQRACEVAIDAGYRLIDTAYMYQNEREVGQAVQNKINEGVVKREDMFITTKLWATHMNPIHVRTKMLESLANLQMSYVDLYIIHQPMAVKYSKDSLFPVDNEGKVAVDPTDLLDTWKALEGLVDECLARSIGVSNFTVAQLQRIVDGARIPPVNQQIEGHVYCQQNRQFEFCKSNDISVTCYGPVGAPYRFNRNNPDKQSKILIEDPTILKIASAHGKTPAQICLRFLLQSDRAVIPKSITPDRIKENIQVFDFELSYEDMSAIQRLNRNERFFLLVSWKGIAGHPEYPMNEPMD